MLQAICDHKEEEMRKVIVSLADWVMDISETLGKHVKLALVILSTNSHSILGARKVRADQTGRQTIAYCQGRRSSFIEAPVWRGKLNCLKNESPWINTSEALNCSYLPQERTARTEKMKEEEIEKASRFDRLQNRSWCFILPLFCLAEVRDRIEHNFVFQIPTL